MERQDLERIITDFQVGLCAMAKIYYSANVGKANTIRGT